MKVLVVDDSKFSRKRVVSALSDLECEIVQAGDGAEGFEAFQKEQPDLVVSDLLMPKVDGIEQLKMIRENRLANACHYCLRRYPGKFTRNVQRTWDCFLLEQAVQTAGTSGCSASCDARNRKPPEQRGEDMNEMTTTKPVSLDEEQFDVLQELINIGVGRAADSLSQLVDARIQLCVPTIQLLEAEEAQNICSMRPNSEETIITSKFYGND